MTTIIEENETVGTGLLDEPTAEAPCRKGHRIDVLDHGFVRLVDSMGSDLSIVRAARVSHAADWRAGENEDKDERLIRYLLRNRHSTPFEAVTFTFEVKAPIFVIRQWHRHRTWSYNEVSARYTELNEGYYIPDANKITGQSRDNKQARDAVELPNSADIARIIDSSCSHSFQIYDSLLRKGCPRELARSVLPVAAYTRMFATVNLHNLLHFLQLRLHLHAQYEIRIYAEALARLVSFVVPVTMTAVSEAMLAAATS